MNVLKRWLTTLGIRRHREPSVEKLSPPDVPRSAVNPEREIVNFRDHYDGKVSLFPEAGWIPLPGTNIEVRAFWTDTVGVIRYRFRDDC